MAESLSGHSRHPRIPGVTKVVRRTRSPIACATVVFVACVVAFAPSRVAAQTCPSDAHPVTQYGAFTPDASDSATIAINNATINRAVAELGQAGGGTICIPQGTFYIGPNPRLADRALTIGFDNITIQGAGIGRTVLRTNGTWVLVDGAVRRGHGIIINGSANCRSPRKNITLRDFELDGQAGWTGEYNWPADPATGAGWDVSHKGIVPAWDACTDSVTLERLYVHHYRGEILYCGGMGMGRLVVREVRMAHTNGSDFNLYGADLLVEGCQFDGPSRFWMELTARANQGGYAGNRTVVRNCTFRDAVGATGIAVTQGDFQPYEFTFENNSFRDDPSGVFGFYGGVAGPVRIADNTIVNCGTVLEFGQAPGWVSSPANANVTFENNTADSCGMLVSFFATARNVMVRNNRFTGRSAVSPGSSTAVVYGAADLSDAVVQGNTFANCRTPEQSAGITGERPLFAGNVYVNVESRDQQGWFGLSNTEPWSPRLITPHFEYAWLDAREANVVVELRTDSYPEGQKVTFIGGTTARPVLFARAQTCYVVAQDRFLRGDSLSLWFSRAAGAWVETPTAVRAQARKPEEMRMQPERFSAVTGSRVQVWSGGMCYSLCGRRVEPVAVRHGWATSRAR